MSKSSEVYAKWYAKNGKKYHQEWRDQNRERFRAFGRKAYHKNKGKPTQRFNTAKAGAKRRGLEWTLTREEYSALLDLPCYYCRDYFARTLQTGVGLDRIDNFKGYTADNVLRCCWHCNDFRGNSLDVAEAEILISRLINLRSK